jgi:hypothetical protein
MKIKCPESYNGSLKLAETEKIKENGVAGERIEAQLI